MVGSMREVEVSWSSSSAVAEGSVGAGMGEGACADEAAELLPVGSAGGGELARGASGGSGGRVELGRFRIFTWRQQH